MATRSDLERCSIDRWYPKLSSVSIRTTILPLSDDFVKYLLADSVFVAADADHDDSAEHLSEDDADDWDSDTAAADEASRFPELEAAIAAAIRKHGGEVFPKLNWSAPKDAAWVLGGSLKCTSARDVLLLLKSSDNVSHDLCDARRVYSDAAATDAPSAAAATVAAAAAAAAASASGDVPAAAAVADGAADSAADSAAGRAMESLSLDPSPAAHRWVLALRRWCHLRPSSEFRAFCCGGVLLGACQRDRFSHYGFLHEARERLAELLAAFALANLRSSALPHRLVFDAYVDIDERVHLIDVAPFHESVDPVLFAWGELQHVAHEVEARAAAAAGGPAAAHRAELRLVEEGGGGVAPSAQMYYGLPHDLRECDASDLSALVATAKKAAGDAEADEGEEEGSATGAAEADEPGGGTIV